MHRISKLKNGITLITVPVAGTKATTVLCMFPVGSRYETRKLSGASHFVEHMLFKGTANRPSAQDISRTLERVGAEYNAFTYKDYTGYYVKIDGSEQELAFDLLSDMIYHSKIEAEEVEKEKGAIVEELRMYEDNPTMAVDILFDRVAYGNHPLGWDVGGTEQTVRGMTREELWSYYQRHYSPKNMVLVVAGNMEHKRIKKLLNYFEGKKASTRTTAPSYYTKQLSAFSWPKRALPLDERVAVTQRKVDQTHVIMGFPGLRFNAPERYAAALLLNILGAGMSSRLFVEVREKRGLAYMIRTGSAAHRDTGVSYVQAGLDPARLEEALQVIRAELARIALEPVTTRELADAKTSAAGRLALHMEDSSAQAEWFAKQFLFASRIQTPDEYVRELQKVRVADAQKVAKQFFDPHQMRLAVITSLAKEQVLKIIP